MIPNWILILVLRIKIQYQTQIPIFHICTERKLRHRPLLPVNPKEFRTKDAEIWWLSSWRELISLSASSVSSDLKYDNQSVKCCFINWSDLFRCHMSRGCWSGHRSHPQQKVGADLSSTHLSPDVNSACVCSSGFKRFPAFRHNLPSVVWTS